jgi:hypothetical protein
MKEASWKYGHQQQILVDGTFGVCDRRLLLFIVMGIDEQRHGVPLAFLLFSAPAGNQATHGGYDTAILVKVLGQWKDLLTKYREQTFLPSVAITDTDFKERGALVEVFPGIKLLICWFHLRQRWSNHCGKHLRGNAPGQKTVLDRVIALEHQLLESKSFKAAKRLISDEMGALNQMAMNSMYASAAGRGATHLEYLSLHWVTEALWESWSDGGRLAAALRIGIAINEVVMTNNHLESFNGLLKHKMLKGWSRGGRRIRVDTLVFMLALKVAQSIFQQRRLKEEEREMIRNALQGVPGADELLGSQRAMHSPIETPVAYLCPDARRDKEANILLQHRRVSWLVIHEKGVELTCWSAKSKDAGGAPIAYIIWLGFDKVALCTCPNFRQQGGACKHMRAALRHVWDLKSWVHCNRVNDPIAYAPDVDIPANKAAAVHKITTRYQASIQDRAYSGPMSAKSSLGGESLLARAAHCVNEALQGGFLGDLDEKLSKEPSGSESSDYDMESVSSEDNKVWGPSDDEVSLDNKFN